MKKIILPLLAILLLAACEKESTSEIVVPEVNNYENGSVTTRSSNKRDVCHNGHIININVKAIPAHQAHGDAVDMDEDGYFDIDNPCSETDCDDTDAAVNPGVDEVCGNEVDDDCDGEVNEGCFNCPYFTVEAIVSGGYGELYYDYEDCPFGEVAILITGPSGCGGIGLSYFSAEVLDLNCTLFDGISTESLDACSVVLRAAIEELNAELTCFPNITDDQLLSSDN